MYTQKESYRHRTILGDEQRGSRKGVAVGLAGVIAAVLVLAMATVSWAEPVEVFYDGFENGNVHGWQSLGEPAETAVGLWEFGDPNGTYYNGTPAQPENAAVGPYCAFTGQNTTLGIGDVDFGAVFLVSPPINLAGFDTAEISYYRWFFIRELNEDPHDYFRVQARSRPSASWVTLENLDNTAWRNWWELVSIPVHDFVELTATVQFRFVASDAIVGTIVEGAVDEVRVVADTLGCSGEDDCATGHYCALDGTCLPYGDGDMDGDGDCDMVDFAAFQCCYSQPAEGACAAGNLAGDVLIGPEDVAAWVQRLVGPGERAR